MHCLVSYHIALFSVVSHSILRTTVSNRINIYRFTTFSVRTRPYKKHEYNFLVPDPVFGGYIKTPISSLICELLKNFF